MRIRDNEREAAELMRRRYNKAVMQSVGKAESGLQEVLYKR